MEDEEEEEVATSWFAADSSVWHATIAGLLAAKTVIITNTIIRLFITLWYSCQSPHGVLIRYHQSGLRGNELVRDYLPEQ
jgi:hypothetical protein